ncbi:9940_t:CDS:2, partial [Entrophospora sp. SA101]
MRSDATRISSEDYDYIIQYKDAKSKPLDMLRDKYPMSNTHAVTSSLCETEKIDRISEAKKETISSSLPNISQDSEDVLDLYNRSQKEQKK